MVSSLAIVAHWLAMYVPAATSVHQQFETAVGAEIVTAGLWAATSLFKLMHLLPNLRHWGVGRFEPRR